MNRSKRLDPRQWIKVLRSGGLGHARLDGEPADGMCLQTRADQCHDGRMAIGDAALPYSMIPMVP